MISKLTEVPIREVWKHEAKNFTVWLGDNLEYLEEQLGIILSLEETEKSVGSFFVDILAKDNEGNLAIIENQLEKTDHDHLGKLLTYLSNLNAKIAIWISPTPRPEHEIAINHLNQFSPDDTKFYLIKIQAYKIDSSASAPLFTIVAGPQKELRDIGKIKSDISKKDKIRFEFFSKLLEYSNTRTNLFSNISPIGYQNWTMTGAGKQGLSWAYYIMSNNANVHLFFSSTLADKNKKRFNEFFAYKVEIDNEFGENLDWDFSEGRKQQYIKCHLNIGGLNDTAKWDSIIRELVEKMIKLENILGNYLKKIE